ncbi:(E3-independent) E2 ubiquitin-conjugating enzyme-like [Culicoides brevitarsis]|uniref:(E3-independent) E2 ubiquitin-conjugating enzyme-like n=1 Tax=Culicoides brevitarsis TaxID=469753 RepID=UPI00307C3607
MSEQREISENEDPDLAEDEEDDDEDCFGFDDDSYFNFQDDEPPGGEKPPGTDENQNVSKLFEFLDEAPPDHSFLRHHFTPNDSKVFTCAMVSERTMMLRDLPEGVHVKFFENRLDLSTCMIEGPKHTPYADCLFFFDIQMSQDYPKSAPKVKFLSYTTQKLNPNLYDTGYVCLSLLGTWPGDTVETWSAAKSSLLQLFVSIQGLILVAEPFYNEPGYHHKRGIPKFAEKSQKYNGDIMRLVLGSMWRQIERSPMCFAKEVEEHYTAKGQEICNRFEMYLENPSIAPFPMVKTEDFTYAASELKALRAVVTRLQQKQAEIPPKTAN